MPFEEAGPPREPVERVAEHEDQLAEAQVLGDRDIQTSKDRIISQFDTSTVSIAELQALVPQLRNAMDELISKTVVRLVNVKDIKDLPPGKLAEIKEVIELRLEEFREAVEREAPKKPEQAVALAKEKKELWFEERVTVARETQNDAEFKLSATPTAVTMEYAEKNPKRPKVTLTVTTNERFFESTQTTTEGTAAARIEKNKESGTYRIEGANDRIQNPKVFREWTSQQLQALSINPRTASAEQLTRAATEIIKKNLKITTDPNKGFEKLPQDQMPIDQLLQTQQEGCCRHFTVATRVVFEQIQTLAAEQQNQNLNGIVAFENEMGEMGHATLALARGNEITTIDPFWYAAGVQSTPDSTFDGRHGNITSLYRTLSKKTEGNPTGNLFDLGSSEKLVRQLHGNDGQIPEEMRQNVDNTEQAILMRAREVIVNQALQTPANLIATVQSLRAIVPTLKLQEPEDALALASIQHLAPILAEVIDLQKNNALQTKSADAGGFKLAEVLYAVGLKPALQSKTASGNPEARDEELIETCEAALRDQQFGREEQREILHTAAAEMLSNVWRSLQEKFRFIQAKNNGKGIGSDGMYEERQETDGENDRYVKILDASKTILEPAVQWVDKVVRFIVDKGLTKTMPDIRNDIELKHTTLGQTRLKAPGTFAERMAATLQEKFKVA